MVFSFILEKCEIYQAIPQITLFVLPYIVFPKPEASELFQQFFAQHFFEINYLVRMSWMVKIELKPLFYRRMVYGLC